MAAKIPVEFVLVGKEKITEGLKDIAKVAAAAFATDKIISFAAECRKAAQEDEKAQKQLSAAIGGVSAALQVQTVNLSNQYKLQQGNIVATQNAISLHFKSVDAIKTLTPAIIDMSLATGKSTEEIAKQVTAAIESGKGIKEYGIYLDKARNENERIKLIAEEITKKFSAQANAAVENKDALDNMSTAFSELQGNIGNFMKIPAVAAFTNWITESIQGLNDMAVAASYNAMYEEMAAKNKALAQAIRDRTEAQTKLKAIQTEMDDAKKNKDLQRQFELNGDIYVLQNKIAAAQSEIDKQTKTKAPASVSGLDEKNAAEEAKKAADRREKLLDAKRKDQEKEAKEAQELRDKNLEALEKDAEAQVRLGEDVLLEDLKLNRRRASALKELANFKIDNAIEVNNDLESIEQRELRNRQTKERRDLIDHLNSLKEERLIAESDAQQAISALERRQANDRMILNEQENKEKVNFALDTSGQIIGTIDAISEAAGASARERKRLAQAEAFISGAKGVLGVLENSGQYIGSFGPIGGPIAMGIEIAAMIGLATAQIASIGKANMAYGGTAESRIITGGVPGQDSVATNLMPGEIVYNPRHPNPMLAAQIAATVPGLASSNKSSVSIGGPTIVIQGKVGKETVDEIGRVSEKAILSALKKAQLNGKLYATNLTVRS